MSKLNNDPTPIVLASTSRYRAELLKRLNLSFQAQSPNVDEAHRDGEQPRCRAARLARAKALALASQHPACILIGSDQVAACDDEVFDKPGTAPKSINTLMKLRGQQVDFHTAVCVCLSAPATSIAQQQDTSTAGTVTPDHATEQNSLVEYVDLTTVHVRADLTEDEIVRYVTVDQPLDCAGAFKVETSGIALFEAIETKDPTALIGLPLIAVARALRSLGIRVP